MTQLIIKNLTTVEQYVEDLGIYIPASTSVDFTELFNWAKYSPATSSILLDFVNNDILLLNDGTNDISKADTASFLIQYAVNNHERQKHTGGYPENKIIDSNVFARLADNEIITGVWKIDSQNGGQLIIEHGTALPSGTPEDGRVFWHMSEELLYASANGIWNNITYISDVYYQSPLIYEFGSYSTFSSGYLNTQWKTSSTSPVIVPNNGTIKSLTCDAGSDNGTVNAYKFIIRRKESGSWVDFTSISKTDGPGHIYSNTFNVDFNAGDEFACYAEVTSGNGDLTNPHMYLEVVWREV